MATDDSDENYATWLKRNLAEYHRWYRQQRAPIVDYVEAEWPDVDTRAQVDIAVLTEEGSDGGLDPGN